MERPIDTFQLFITFEDRYVFAPAGELFPLARYNQDGLFKGSELDQL